ncbi:MAG: hypothetical protein R6U94_09835 [Nitriliruptoraceae bacterium]
MKVKLKVRLNREGGKGINRRLFHAVAVAIQQSYNTGDFALFVGLDLANELLAHERAKRLGTVGVSFPPDELVEPVDKLLFHGYTETYEVHCRNRSTVFSIRATERRGPS